jgi:hypothetical protein
MHDAALGRSLVMIARCVIGTALGSVQREARARELAHPALEAPGATFRDAVQ